MDIEILNTLNKMLKGTSVAEFEFQKADVTINIKTNGVSVPAVSAEPVETVSAEPEKKVLIIRSIDVGIFSTGKINLSVGDSVKKGQTVGEIISMGISHALKSEVDGVITAQMVKNKEPVEYGEVIFEVEGA